MLESEYKTGLAKRIEQRFPGCFVLHLDPNELQGIPDLLILGPNHHWATLEGKQYDKASHRPNQDYYVNLMNEMAFSAFVYPENEEEVLYAMEQSFQT